MTRESIEDAAKRLNISAEAVKTYLDAGTGERADGVERSLHATIKPVGSACNAEANPVTGLLGGRSRPRIAPLCALRSRRYVAALNRDSSHLGVGVFAARSVWAAEGCGG
jgi:hypothetical protein